MSIATELQNLNDNILDAYTAVQGKGGTVPADKNTANLDTAIASIPSGPGAYIPREVVNGVFQIPTAGSGITSFALPSDATDIGAYALINDFYLCTSLISVDLGSITTISGVQALYYAFYRCTRLTSVDLSSLTTISGIDALGYAFSRCTSLTNIDLSSLTTVSGNNAMQDAFYQCTRLTSVDLSSLTTISGAQSLTYVFGRCTSLANVGFSSLTTIGSEALRYAFFNCTSLRTLSFPALTTSSFGSRTDQFDSMLTGCSNVTVHFPAAIQSTIGSWASVTSGFGGTNTTVLFDL